MEADKIINVGDDSIAADANGNHAFARLGCPTLIGPTPCGPAGVSVSNRLNSSPEFEPGDSAVKRRCTKKKGKGISCVESLS